MNLLEYQTAAKRTCPDLGSDLLNSLHMTIGMATEIGETILCLKKSKQIDKVNLQEELGDIFWYFANYATLISKILLNDFEFKKGFYFQEEYEMYTNLRCYDLVLMHATDLLDYDKKALAYKKTIDQDKALISFYNLFKALSDTFYTYGLDPERALQNNIDKLKIRYPEKFTTENAINRDLEKERQELEK